MDNIKRLLNLLNKGEIDAAQSERLHNLLNGDNSEVNNVFEEEWNNSEMASYSFDTKEVLTKIKNKIGSDGSPNRELHKMRFIKSVLRYAAILFIGFGISWLLNNYLGNKQASQEASKYCKVNVPYGSKTKIELPDGTIVNLNSGSSLSYPTEFNKASRVVKLEGEAFFDVTKNADCPFYVKTKDILIKVLGTSFNVKTYADDEATETTLLTGRVEIFKNELDKLPEKNDKPIAVLNPMQKVVVLNGQLIENNSHLSTKGSDSSNLPEKIKTIQVVEQPNAIMRTEWRNDKLIFDNDKLSDIMVIIERWYNVEITMDYTEIEQIRFSGKFDRESITEVLDVLSLLQKFKYEIHKNKVIITKNKTIK